MNVANLELSKELYELSGWEDTALQYYWRTHQGDKPRLIGNFKHGITYCGRQNGFEIDSKDRLYPAYDLGFLMRKVKSGGGITAQVDRFTARRPSMYGVPEQPDPLHGRIGWDSENPEDAMCIMLIELFKQGVISRETVS